MRTITLALLLAVLTLGVGCGGSDSPGGDSAASPEAKPGSAAVYARISRERDCRQLQREFDRAEQTHERGGSWAEVGTAYMKAADARMRKVGCY